MKEEEVLSGLLKRIGRKLTELRKQKGYTSHDDFAFDHELPRVQYWRLGNGETNLTIKSLVRVLSIHKMTVEEFFVQMYKDGKKGL